MQTESPQPPQRLVGVYQRQAQRVGDVLLVDRPLNRAARAVGVFFFQSEALQPPVQVH